MPAKSGNLDCTLCMDCVKACPHDNIGLFVEPPAQELVQIAAWDPQRSSVGRYSRRADVAAVALVVVSAAFASAAVMVEPVAARLDRAAERLPGWLASSAGLGLAVAAPLVLFALLLGAVLAMHGRLQHGDRAFRGAGDGSLRAQLCRWTLALLPVGLGMWAAHLCFHLVTAAGALGPALSQAGRDLHLVQGPGWAAGASLLSASALLQLQLGLLDAGLLFALYLGWRMVRSVPAPARPLSTAHAGRASIAQSLWTLAPWASVVLLLYGAGVWVLLEPMQMRGMMGM
jgi:hypothetical protein